MTSSLAAHQRRIAALGLLAVYVVALWSILVAPIIHYIGSRNGDRQAALKGLARDRALVWQEPRVRAALADVNRSARWARFYDGTTSEKAALELQSDVRAMLKASTARDTSMTVLPAAKSLDLTRVAVRVSCAMPIDQLVDFFGRLQSHTKLLQITNLVIQAPDYQPVESNPTLSIQAEVIGYMFTPSDKPGGS